MDRAVIGSPEAPYIRPLIFATGSYIEGLRKLFVLINLASGIFKEGLSPVRLMTSGFVRACGGLGGQDRCELCSIIAAGRANRLFAGWLDA